MVCISNLLSGHQAGLLVQVEDELVKTPVTATREWGKKQCPLVLPPHRRPVICGSLPEA